MSCDPHIVKKEDQFQEQSLSEKSLFCHHLTEVYSQQHQTFISDMQVLMVCARVKISKRQSDLFVQYHLQTCCEKQSGDVLHQKDAKYTK